MRIHAVACGAALVALVGASAAHAQSMKVYTKLKGQLLISDIAFDDVLEDAEELKKRSKLALTKAKEDPSWPFFFVAFCTKKPGTADVSLFFYEKGKKDMSFYRDLGVDPEAPIVAFDLTFSEDDGVKPNTQYKVVLGKMDGSKVIPLAQGQVTFK